MRIATWNVNSLKARLPRVEEWLGYADADVLVLQETKFGDTAFPSMVFHGLGYESVHFGQGQWNGVAILSRVGLDDVQRGFTTVPGDVNDYTAGVLGEARVLSATCAGLRVTSVYVPNGRSLEDPHYQAKLVWLDRLSAEHSADAERPAVIMGDFNVAPDDRDVWKPSAFTNSTHVTEAERARLRDLEAAGFRDAFRHLYDSDRLYTYWDYRAGDFHQHRGMRIDLVLATSPVIDRVRWAIVDRNARKGKLPSDHAPVVVDLEGSFA